MDLGPLTLRYYGVAVALAVLAAIVLTRWRFAQRGGDPETVDAVALWAVLAGLVGARLAWVSTNLDQVVERPIALIAIWEGGLAFFGGLLLGGLAVVWQLRRRRASIPAFADAVAPAIPLGQAIGRWGNYFNEELYGTATDLPWALELSTGELVHPTFLYEMLGNLAIMAVLMVVGLRGLLRPGGLLLAYGIGYGLLRFSLEFIRTDGNIFIFGISGNTYTAAGLFLASIAALVWWQRREPAASGAPADGRTGASGGRGRSRRR